MIDTHDKPVRVLARELGVVVVSVGFRLAPEHPHPAQLDDCETATRYFIRHAQEWNVDPARVAVAGLKKFAPYPLFLNFQFWIC